MTSVATETAYAKINLALHVRQRRSDGYHAIESLFAFAEDGDVISASPRDDGEITLSIDGPFGQGLDAGEDNLVLKAAIGLRELTGVAQGADIFLRKNLPVASGIGGGSADAAATLRLLSKLWGVDVDMTDLACALGSDVPACLVSRTVIGSGRGEALKLHELDGLPGAPLLLVNPGVSLSTAPVFARWDCVDRGPLEAISMDSIVRDGRNDLYAPAASLVPEVRNVMAHLSGQPGVLLARMSGSGATCFALFRSIDELDAAAAALPPQWWSMATRIRAA